MKSVVLNGKNYDLNFSPENKKIELLSDEGIVVIDLEKGKIIGGKEELLKTEFFQSIQKMFKVDLKK